MSVARKYLPCLTLPLMAMMVALMVPRRAPERFGVSQETSARKSSDVKLKRTLRTFDDAPATQPKAAPLYLINEPGLEVALHLDPVKWDIILRAENRRPLKDRRYNTAIRFGDRPDQPGVLSVRGMGTLNEPGKPNFRIKLIGSQQIAPDIKLNELFLMNLRYDEGHVQMMMGYRLLRELGLFPSHVQYARVTVNDAPLGMFLLVEPPVDAIRRVHPDTVSIYRRRDNNIYIREWARSVPDAGWPVKELTSLNFKHDLPDPLQAYSEVIDLDSYFTYLAVNSIVMNTDIADEMFLYERRAPGQQTGKLHVMGWDYDDTFNPKPRRGSFDDPLIYSSEDYFDLNVQRYPTLYSRYRATLARLLTTILTEEKVVRALRDVQAERDGLDDGRSPELQETDRAARKMYVDTVEPNLRARHAELRRLTGNE